MNYRIIGFLFLFISITRTGMAQRADMQELDADTLLFFNETEFRDFVRFYDLKDYDIISGVLTSDCSTIPADISDYPGEGTDNYLHEELFGELQCIYILDHLITRKMWTILLPTIGDPDADLCFVRIWVTNPFTGQVVMFDNVFNWLDENAANIFNLNKKMYFLYGFDTDQVGFKTSQLQVTTGYDFTFPDLYPDTHDTVKLRFDGIDMYQTSTYYTDSDMDGYGNPDAPVKLFVEHVGYVIDSTDCDDTNASVFPGATEVSNDIDDNCDGETDEGFPDNITGLSLKEYAELQPNPASDKFHIESVEGITAISITDMRGGGQNIYRAGNEVDISDLEKGIYIVRISTISGDYIKRLIKL